MFETLVASELRLRRRINKALDLLDRIRKPISRWTAEGRNARNQPVPVFCPCLRGSSRLGVFGARPELADDQVCLAERGPDLIRAELCR